MYRSIYMSSNGYAEELVQKLFNAYSIGAYLNTFDLQVIRQHNSSLVNVSSLVDDIITFKGLPVTLSFTTKLKLDNNLPIGSIRFEAKHPDYRLLFADNRLPSNRLERIAILTEAGEYLAI